MLYLLKKNARNELINNKLRAIIVARRGLAFRHFKHPKNTKTLYLNYIDIYQKLNNAF